MRRAILLMLLAVVSNSAMAGWVKVVTEDHFNNQSPCEKNCYFVHVDIASIDKTGNTIKMWRLNNFEKPPTSYSRYKQSANDKPHLSVKIQDEYDCKGKRTRFLFASYHSHPMGEGQVVHTESIPTEWFSIGERSSREGVAAFLWRAVCEKQ